MPLTPNTCLNLIIFIAWVTKRNDTVPVLSDSKSSTGDILYPIYDQTGKFKVNYF